MRIGVDFDDTICRTTEIVHKRVEEYAKVNKLDPLEIMNDEVLKQSFFNIYLEDIYANAEIKRDVAKVLRRLRNKGNEIYIVTYRNNKIADTVKNVEKLIKKWLEEHNIIVDEIIIDAYGEAKANICNKYDIDLMIDDDPYNYKKIIESGRKCLLFDDREKYEMRNDYVTSWKEIEEYIERNR